MAKRALLDVLSSTIGRYVRDLDEEKLNVAVWSGKIELSNLSLDIDAVNAELARQAREAPNLAIPLRVVEGRFDSLKVEVPWARITSRPVVVRAAGLKVVVEPHSHLSGRHGKNGRDGGDGDSSWQLGMSSSEVGGVETRNNDIRGAVIKRKREARVQSLNYADESRRRANALRKLAALDNDETPKAFGDKKSAPNASEADGATFAGRLVRRIAENLQLDFESVHVSLRGCGCSAGILLGSLSLFTTDANGQRTFVDRGMDNPNQRKNRGVFDSFLYKELQIQGLGIYCDEDEVSPLERMQQRLQSPDEAALIHRHSYILSPLSFTCRLRRSDMLRCVEFPKYQITSELKTLSIMLSRSQLDFTRRITESVAAKKDVVRPLYPEYRPALPVSKATAKEWWQYALRCIGRLNRRRCWTEFYIAFQKRKVYISLYKRSAHHASCPWLSKLSIAETAELDKLEQDQTISAQGIMCWRNIADAQVEREREKHDDAMATKKGIRPGEKLGQKNNPWTSVFGRAGDRPNRLKPGQGGDASKVDGRQGDGGSEEEDDIPPIELSAEEMQELEAIGLNASEETSALSADSVLCNISFTLGSFRVNLVSYGLQALTSLQMGTVATTFGATADGSFESRLTMNSLTVDDMVTARSLFPCVVRSLQYARNGAPGGSLQHALDFSYNKSKTGDQHFALSMVAYEIVASSLLLKEVVDFFAVRGSGTVRVNGMRTPQKRNPILQESLTGSVDLFYDADYGESEIMLPSMLMSPRVEATDKTHSATAALVSDRLAAALAEAWSSKTQSKRSWTIECDIHAPILIVPESCVDREAPVLIFDLGSFNFVYGKSEPCQEVQQWFDDHPMRDAGESTIDHCSLMVKELTVAVCKAGSTKSLEILSCGSNNERPKQEAITVVEPIALVLKIGIEGSNLSLDKSRKCIHGVLPEISIQLSPVMVNSILRIYSKWMEFLDTLVATVDPSKSTSQRFFPLLEDAVADDSTAGDGGIQILPAGSGESSPTSATPGSTSVLVQASTECQAPSNAQIDSVSEEALEYLHFSLALRKLSTSLAVDGSSGIEAHLVSVVLSSTISTDGSSSNRCRMGWFWLLDRLQVDYSRKERMLAHSLLTRPASDYSKDDSYDIIADLEDQGVFDEAYSGCSDLADIVITRSVSGGESSTSAPDETIQVDATFTSLFLNWNPRAIKNIMNQSNLFDLNFPGASHPASKFTNRSSLLRKLRPVGGSRNSDMPSSFGATKNCRRLTLKAQMTSLSLSLNSAIDDLSLYSLIMADAKLNTSISDLTVHPRNQAIDATFIVGDIKMETSATGRALDDYTTIIGLAPNQSTSLLTVGYRQGDGAMDSCTLDGLDKDNFFSYAEIDVSPVRFVYIQAQILTLTEYVTEGVLGALFAKVASSAAAAAMEMAQTTEDEDKLFQFNATGLDLVIPQAASSENFFAINAGDLDVRYAALANDRGGKAKCLISDVTLACNRSLPMLYEPIRMSIDVFLSAIDGETEEDRAIKVDVEISQASFLLTRRHYGQIMDTLATNISEENSFLRDEISIANLLSPGSKHDSGNECQQPRPSSLSSTTSGLITHGGVDLVIIQRHIYVQVLVAKLSVDLCKEDTNETIVSLAAVKADILFHLLPEQDKIWSKVTLHDLVCEDRRLEALNRRFHRLVSCQHNVQDKKFETGSSAANDVFCVIYEKSIKDEVTDVDLKIGSPQVVVIPDCIVEVLEFLKAGIRPPVITVPSTSDYETYREADLSTLETKITSKAHDEVEASSKPLGPNLTKQRMKVAIKTSNCRLILVDMGSAPAVEGAPLTKSLKRAAQLTETVVIQGKVEAVVDFTSDIMSGRIIEGNHQLHGDNVEIYTAQGVELFTPIQILEPSVFSIFLTTSILENGREDIEVKAVTLSHVEMILSMQNIALIKAIISSISDSFAKAEERKADGTEDHDAHILSEKEKARIERLASALDKNEETDTEQSSHPEQSYSGIEGSYHGAATKANTTKFGYVFRIKATFPETILTVVNDLQGLDDALFKLLFKNFVLGGEFDFPPEEDALPQFRFHVNTAVVSNYFDTNSLLWESLLVKPWELQFNGMRAPQKRFKSNRMSTSFDIDSHPCYLSFSEQFLVSIGAASRMWSVYSSASQKAMDLGKAMEGDDRRSSISTRKSLAACAARSLITTLPYGIENHSGVVAHFFTRFGAHEESRRPCLSGETQYFHFEPSPGDGTGGKRLYGQDVVDVKSLTVEIGDSIIHFEHVDAEINRPRQAHLLATGLYVFTQVVRDMKAAVVHISSHIDISNATPIPFGISVKSEEGIKDIGTCPAIQEDEKKKTTAIATGEGDALSRRSVGFGIPINYLQSLSNRAQRDDGKPSITLVISPLLEQGEEQERDPILCGEVALPNLGSLVQIATSNSSVQSFEVMCSSRNKDRKQDAVIVQVCCRVTLVGSYHPFIELFFQPRALLQNNLPISVVIRTPMPHTFSSCSKLMTAKGNREEEDSAGAGGGYENTRTMDGQTIHFLEPFDSIKIFTPGPSVAVAALCADQPTGGRRTGWMDAGWVDLPLGRNARLPEPSLCLFPFVKRDGEPASIARGSEFFILEGLDGLPRSDNANPGTSASASTPERDVSIAGMSNVQAARADDPMTHVRTMSIAVQNYAVDHTGDILFEQVAKNSPTSPTQASSITSGSPHKRRSFHPPHLVTIPFSAFSSSYHLKRVTLLPPPHIPIRILKLTMEGDEGTKRSSPFVLDNIPLSEGGIESTVISWADDKRSSYYAYKRLSSANQYELHIIPEFVIYNGSTVEMIIVKQPGVVTPVEPGRVAPIHSGNGPATGLILMIEFTQSIGSTAPIKVDSLGIKICVVKSNSDGCPIGSVAIQTVIGSRDSRLVIKVGAIKYGGLVGMTGGPNNSEETFADDLFRFRIRWSEMEVTLIDTQRAMGKSYGKSRQVLETALGDKNDPHREDSTPRGNVVSSSSLPYKNVAQFLLHRFTVDFQRIFKDEETSSTATGATLQSPERTQLAIIIHSVRITDCDSNAVSPIVLESPSNSHFFDLCVRTRGSHSADLVKVDLIDLNMSYTNGKADCIVINTGEDFLWRLFDVASRTIEATAALAGVDIELEWDEEKGTFIVSTIETTTRDRNEFDSMETYRPPQSDKMFDVRTARVSPIRLLVSFKRQPSLSRYQLVKGVRGAKLMNYVTTRLKFTVDRADIRFAGYVVKNVKGPPDRLIEMIVAVYSSRLKFKLVTLLNSVTLQDWRYLSGREDRGDEYVEGDILRLTGNLAGRSAGYVLKKVGQGLGDGVSSFTGSIGDEIQRSSERVGAGAVGASVNSVVSGLGDGVGSSIKGVGAGSGKLFRGAGKGIGQVVGGVGGGVLLAAKGIGKGITTGDGSAVISGLGDGLNSVGTGIGRGVETAALGATDGVLTAGQGLVSGVGSIGRGIGGAFRGESESHQYHHHDHHQQQQQQQQQQHQSEQQEHWRPGQRIRARRERRMNATEK